MSARSRYTAWPLLILVAVCISLGSGTGSVHAAAVYGSYSPEAESAFSRGLDAYRGGRYEDAVRHLQPLLASPTHQRTTAASLLLARAQYHLHQYAASLETAQALQRRFADSRYAFCSRLLVGDCYFSTKRYYDAAAQYGRLLATSAPLWIQARAAERLAAIVARGLISTGALNKVRDDVGTQRTRDALLYGRARWYGRLGWEPQRLTAMRAYLDSLPNGIFAGYARAQTEGRHAAPEVKQTHGGGAVAERQRSRMVRGHTSGPLRLGLLLPLSGTGFQRQVGDDLHAGIQLANDGAEDPFELVVADIGTDYGDLPIVEDESSQLIRVIQQTQRLIYDEGVVAIIGPVFSSDCVAAAVVAASAGVPIILPLAQQSGLDQLGDNLFQLSSIPETQARALAEYATLVLGLQTFAVIAPLTDYGWGFEREFRRVAYENGGDVVHADWYVPGVTKDFRRVFEEIRQVGFGLMPPPPDTLSTVDTLGAAVTDSIQGAPEPSFLTELLAGLDEPVEHAEPRPEAVPPDSSEMFIDTIDGIAVVVEKFEDAQTIAPQVQYHRLQTQVLGNDIWYDPEAIRQMRPADRVHVEGTVLVSGSLPDDNASTAFIRAFQVRFAREPGYAAYGFDATGMLLAAREEGQRTPEGIRAWLSGLREYRGASGRISFTSQRHTNDELELLKIDRHGRIRRVTGGDLPALTGATSAGGPDTEADLPRASLLPEELETGR